MEPQIDEYIQKQKTPQKEIILKVREIFKNTLIDFKEEKAWGVLSYSGGKFYLAAIKDRVHVGFAIAGLSNEDLNFFEGNGKTMRHIKIKTLDGLDEKKLVKLIKLVEKKASCQP